MRAITARLPLLEAAWTNRRIWRVGPPARLLVGSSSRVPSMRAGEKTDNHQRDLKLNSSASGRRIIHQPLTDPFVQCASGTLLEVARVYRESCFQQEKCAKVRAIRE